MTGKSIEGFRTRNQLDPKRTLLILKVVLATVLVATLATVGWREVIRTNNRGSAQIASGPQSTLSSLSVIGELPGGATEALVSAPVATALEAQAEKLAREAENRRLAEAKQQAVEAANLPERDVWNGTSPMPGSEIHDLPTMPALYGETRPVVALTFDDGPSEFTAGIVSILRDQQVPGTFFFLGQNVQNRPDDARLVAEAGFTVATHTMDHKDLKTLPSADAEAEFADSIAAIDGLLGGGTVQCARAPYGSFNDDTLQAAKKHGIGLVGWDVDTLDWKVRDGSSIVAKATVPGQRQLVLMHDGGGPRAATVEALPGIIAHYKAQDARFIKLCAPETD